MDEKRIEKIMSDLQCSRAEAINVIECDLKIDKGEKLFELTDEQKKVEKAMRSTGTRKVDAYGKSTERKKKIDDDKIYLMNLIAKALANCDKFEITNPQSTIELVYNGRKFKIVLSAPRK